MPSSPSRSELLLLDEADVRALLSMRECVDAMSEALAALSRGEAEVPVRSVIAYPDRTGFFGMMPAFIGPSRILGAKIIAVMPGNHGTLYDSHQGAVLLFEAEHGSLLAVVEASSLTAIRTAAASGAATRSLARTDAGDLAILGSGVEARTHLEAMRTVRDLRRVRVWSRTEANARAFAERESSRVGVAVEAMATAKDAVDGADLICTTTSSATPVLRGEWIAAGAHVNAMGACIPAYRELDTAAVLRSRLFVDHRPAALKEAGDILIPIQEGAVGPGHILAEIGDVIRGEIAGRTAASDVTLFKSLGLAIEDLAAAHLVYRGALAANRGTRVPWGGRRESA